MHTDLITKVYFNEHLTHSCVGMPQGLQALSSSLLTVHTVKSYKISHQYLRNHICMELIIKTAKLIIKAAELILIRVIKC